jgi:hypothetical protein
VNPLFIKRVHVYIYRRNICIKNNYLCLSKKYESTNEYDCKNRSLTVDKEFTDNNFHTLRDSHHVFLPQIEVVVLVYPNKHHFTTTVKTVLYDLPWKH